MPQYCHQDGVEGDKNRVPKARHWTRAKPRFGRGDLARSLGRVHLPSFDRAPSLGRALPLYNDMGPTIGTTLRQIRTTSKLWPAQARGSLSSIESRRGFHCSQPQRTDGVFKELTSMRVRTPWVEAFRQQQAESSQSAESSTGTSAVPKDRDMKAKHMDDSYHSLVLPLAQDPWLLDTYLNSSGHIRLGTIFMDLDALSGIIACKTHQRRQTAERSKCIHR
jgi:acyl-coenzyme A thioesterase 9